MHIFIFSDYIYLMAQLFIIIYYATSMSLLIDNNFFQFTQAIQIIYQVYHHLSYLISLSTFLPSNLSLHLPHTQITLHRMLKMGDLQSYKRQFIFYIQKRPMQSEIEIKQTFIEFVSNQFCPLQVFLWWISGLPFSKRFSLISNSSYFSSQ